MYNNDEIIFNKRNCFYCCCIYAITFIICLLLIFRFSYSSVLNFRIGSFMSFLNGLYEVIIVVICLMVGKWSFTEYVATMRFYGLNLNMTDEKMTLYNDNMRCEIPLGKDTNVTFCMFGWLILWHYENESKAILIRNTLLGSGSSKLVPYFEQKTNLISLRSDKKKTLESFNINIWNPLKYIKWPTKSTKPKNNN